MATSEYTLSSHSLSFAFFDYKHNRHARLHNQHRRGALQPFLFPSDARATRPQNKWSLLLLLMPISYFVGSSPSLLSLLFSVRTELTRIIIKKIVGIKWRRTDKKKSATQRRSATRHMEGKERALKNYKPVAERKFISFCFFDS